jgi:hypothetical protein
MDIRTTIIKRGISKEVKGTVNYAKGNEEPRDGSKGRLTRQNTIVNVICVYTVSISYMLCVNYNNLCLGYK